MFQTNPFPFCFNLHPVLREVMQKSFAEDSDVKSFNLERISRKCSSLTCILYVITESGKNYNANKGNTLCTIL